jgi:hypothetical protein
VSKTPLLSVVLPVYNGQQYLTEALQSVLSQSFDDFELLVIDDGSSDSSREVVKQFKDTRIKLIENPSNIGLVPTLNKGLSLCQGDLIARMDQDDICDPDRFAKQVAFLQSHPEIDVVGSAIRFFGAIPNPYVFTFPLEHEAIRVALLFYCPLAHPAVMFRRSLVQEGNWGYSDDFRHAEDYHFWSRLLLHRRAANLNDCLLNYRLHQKQYSSALSNKQYEVSLRVRALMLSEAGVVPNPEDIALHESVILEQPLPRADYLEALAGWFGKIEEGNQQTGYWEAATLHQLLQTKFVEVTKRMGANAPRVANGTNAKRYLSQEAAAAIAKQPLHKWVQSLLRSLRARLH